MRLLELAAGIAHILFALWDAFETLILARRVSRNIRLTRVFYRLTWPPWAFLARRIRPGNRRENFLSVFGPLSLLLLLVFWALTLVFGFALAAHGFGSEPHAPANLRGFAAHLYLSGSTFFTLGMGDVTPTTTSGRFLAVLECGTGFAFLALVIGYLPLLSQAFSRREVRISMLDARAGSPPSAGELLRRHSPDPDARALENLLTEWEHWSAELLESHVSFPVLSYFRSQHDNQSWVAAMTSVLDVCAAMIASMEEGSARAARLTFAMARHALVDLCDVFHLKVRAPARDRLSPEALERFRGLLAGTGIPLKSGADADARLVSLRKLYEPYASVLSEFLLMPLPPWLPSEKNRDNWQRIV